MFFQLPTVALLAALLVPTSAFIRFGCANNLVEERADPIVYPGQIASHAHKIVGGSGFGLSMDYAQARSSKCSSCPIKEDFSNYWTPKLYYRYQNGTFHSVPTVGDNMNDQNGGMTVYYLQRGPAGGTLKAFPEGFRMLAGVSSKRNYTGDFAAQGISFACLGANQPETNGLPNYNCPGGLRAQVFFPSCWDGTNLDSADHMSHMSYPASGAYNSGTCPTSHPVQLISLFFEILYDTNQFKDMWYGNSNPFVFSNGDPTGYGFHGDFVNGWDVPTLQKVVDQCTDPNAQGVIEKCPPITIFTGDEQNSCRLPSQIGEKVAGYLPSLPGCNPVTPGPAPAPKNPVCSGQPDVQVGATSYFTDMTSKGWSMLGCASDGNPRTLNDKSSIYMAGVGDTMTVEYCMNFCSGYTYAGLEYAGECWCGNTLPVDRAPKAGIFGNCNMMCKGNSTEFCGGPGALSLYKKCVSGSDCKNVPFGDSGGSSVPVPPSNAAPSVAAQSIAAQSVATPSVAAPYVASPSFATPSVAKPPVSKPSVNMALNANGSPGPSVVGSKKPGVRSTSKATIPLSVVPAANQVISISTVTVTASASTVTITESVCAY